MQVTHSTAHSMAVRGFFYGKVAVGEEKERKMPPRNQKRAIIANNSTKKSKKLVDKGRRLC